MDSMSLDSGEDSKADDMDEMTMPNPGSIQVRLAWTLCWKWNIAFTIGDGFWVERETE